MSNQLVHVFEKAGLGTAPFQVVGYAYQSIGGGGVAGPAIVNGVPNFASCNYCHTVICDIFIIRGSDGKTFRVGSDCVRKTGDKGIIDEVKRIANRERTKRSNDKKQTIINSAKILFTEKRSKFEVKSHPCAKTSHFFVDKTYADYLEFLLTRGGMTGKYRAAKIILESAK